jgi:hypothetical protein
MITQCLRTWMIGSPSCSRTALCVPVEVEPVQEVVHQPLSHPIRLQVRLQGT